MDLRNILNILTEHDHEVKSNLPEANPGATSDLVKSQAKFKSRSDGSNAGMTKDFEVQSLGQFLASHGVKPEADAEEVAAKKDDDAEDLEEFYIPNYDNQPTDTRTKSGKCNSCRGDGTIYDRGQRDVIVCPECDGAGFHDDRFGPVKARDESVYSESEFLGKDGKEPAVKYKDSTEADLADRMFRSKGPKGPDRELADKDEGPNARELRLIKQLSGQTKIDEDELDEVIDAPTRKASNKELQDYLSRTVDKKKLKTDKYKMPYIHRSNIVNKYQKDDDKKNDNIFASDKQVPIVDPDGQQYDLDKLAKDITTRPTRLLSQNEKMVNSDGETIVFFNIGLPALTGLAYNEAKKEFVIINTCPGAGECKTFCYALKGGYVQWAPVSLGQTRRLNWLYNDPAGFFDQLNTEIDLENNKSLVKDDPEAQLAVRWHDAGDFFSMEYLDLAYKLADMHPTVKFYAYTKRSEVSGALQNRPSNFLPRFSQGANKSEEKKVDFATTLHAVTVPKELFNDLLMKDGSKLVKDAKGGWQWDSPEALDQFKERMMIKYPAIKPDTLITYDEMMKKPLGTGSAFGSRNITPIWNVMVKHGDGDDAANRGDVLGVYNLEH